MINLRKHLALALVSGLVAVSAIAGCGQSPTSLQASYSASGYDALSHKKKPTPQPSHGAQTLDLVTIKVKVIELLPADTSGLPHQNFVVQEISPDAGMKLTVNNDTHYGTEVPGLQVGEELTIRGVEYHDSHADGIHWTHHKDRPDDAGFIQTPDGHVYQ